ncbi:killer cell lectin-like receptor subfamily G member 1 isoform X3 [Apteryx mantelli]|uniref:Killer cell lectin-like receptor subfamily G member 1 isoform X3 n=1 Tax=Apteryx mantelli TaxID=2696672 RepID=A0ABM4G3C9_9AVES
MEYTARDQEMEESVTYADLHFTPTPAPQRMKQQPWRCAALSLALLCLLLLLAQIVLVGLSFHLLGQLAGCTHGPWSTEETLSYGQQTLRGQCQFCPAGWLWDAGQCYYFSSAKKTWEQSKEDCCSREAQLVTIRANATLGAHARLLMRQAFLARMSNVDVFHVGLKRDSSQADWKWLDGTALKGLFPIQRFTNSFLSCGRVSRSGLSGGLCREAHSWICEKSAATLQWVQSAPPAFLWGNTTYTCARHW